MYGSVRGVKDVSLSVEAGSVMGFLGPNGAGKTTTISMLMGLIKPTSGHLSLFGQDVQTHGLEARRRIGFLAGDMSLDRGLTGWQQLEYLGNLRGGFDKSYVRDLAKRLDCKLNRKFKTLSRGNKQKVGLIAALMHKPELLILDEPTSGLDPLIQAEFNKIILDHKAAGGTVFISSHMLGEVQELCDQVAFIRQGKIVANKTLSDITSAAPKEVRLTLSQGNAKECLKGLKGVKIELFKAETVHFSYQGDQRTLLRHLAGCPVLNISIRDAELEEIFMKLYEGREDA